MLRPPKGRIEGDGLGRQSIRRYTFSFFFLNFPFLLRNMKGKRRRLFFFFFFFLNFLAAPPKFLGQGSDLSCGCDLSCSCGNAGSLTHCVGPGIKLMPQCCRDGADPVAPQWELQGGLFKKQDVGLRRTKHIFHLLASKRKLMD